MIFEYLFLFFGTIGLGIVLVFGMFLIVGTIGLIAEALVRFLRWALRIKSPSRELLGGSIDSMRCFTLPTEGDQQDGVS